MAVHFTFYLRKEGDQRLVECNHTENVTDEQVGILFQHHLLEIGHFLQKTQWRNLTFKTSLENLTVENIGKVCIAFDEFASLGRTLRIQKREMSDEKKNGNFFFAKTTIQDAIREREQAFEKATQNFVRICDTTRISVNWD